MLLIVMLIVFAVGMVALDALAQDALRGPFNSATFMTYAWVVAVSALGGIASFAGKVKAGQARWVNFAELLGELFISAFAGIITYWLAKYAGLNEYLTAAFIGIAGHMGSRAVFMAEKWFERWGDSLSTNSTKP